MTRFSRERCGEATEKSPTAAFRRVNELTGIPIATRRGWVGFAKVDAGEWQELKRKRWPLAARPGGAHHALGRAPWRCSPESPTRT